jgi:hypothetical protein
MISDTLAFFAPAPFELLIVLILFLILFVIPVILAIKFFRSMLRNKNENIRLRLEVGKLADELEKARKQKGTGGGDS